MFLRRSRFAPAALALLLAACAQAPAQKAEPTATPEPAAAASQPERAAQAPRLEPLPKLELTPQILYQLLLAEIAGQRGNLPLSASAYLDLAKSTRDPRIARRAAEIAHFSRQNEAALDAARLWVEIDPESSQARQMLIGLLVGMGRLNEIEPHLAVLMSVDRDNLGEGMLRLNRLFARSPDKAAVAAMVDRLTEPYLDVPEARYARAQAAAVAGLEAQALKEADAALALRPDWEQAILLKAQVLQRESPDAMFAALRGFAAKYPKARDVRMQYASALASENRPKEAREEFRKLLADFPDNNDVLFAVGYLSFQLKDYAAAEAGFKKLLEQDYAEANKVRLYLGQLAETQKHLPQALEWYRSVSAGERYLSAQIRYALVLSQQGKLDEARAHLQQTGASTNRDRVELLKAEALMLKEAGRPQDAFDVLDRSLQSQPNQPDLLYETALLAERLGRVDVLETNLRKLIQIKPDHAHAYNALGYSFADRNERLEEAKQLVAKALELAPDDPFILDSMGWVLFRQGDLKGALEQLQRAYSLRQDPEIAAHLGEVLWALGRRDDAAKTWREAAKANPDNEVLSNAIKRFAP